MDNITVTIRRFCLQYKTLFLFLFLFLFLSIAQIIDYPPIWPDEILLSEPGYNLFHKGNFGTSLFGDSIKGMKERTYWISPLYPLGLGIFFKLVGFGVFQARLFSILTGALVITIYYLLCVNLFKIKGKIIFIPLSLLLVDNLFLRGSIIARMDILALSLCLWGGYTFLCWTNNNEKDWLLCLSGGLTGLSFITHPVGGAIGLLTIFATLLFKYGVNLLFKPHLYKFGLFFILPILLWVVYIYQDLESFKLQFSAQSTRKQIFLCSSLLLLKDLNLYFNEFFFKQYTCFTPLFDISYIKSGALILIKLFHLSTIFLYILHIVRKGSATVVESFCIFFFLSSTIIFILGAHEMWYVVYIILPLYLICAKVIYEIFQTSLHLLRVLYLALVIPMGLLGISSSLSRTADSFSYEWVYMEISETLEREIPKDSTIFIQAIPDPSFHLYKKGYKIYQFYPASSFDENNYSLLLDNVDYFLFTWEPSPIIKEHLIKHKFSWKIIEIGNTKYFLFLKMKMNSRGD